MKDITPVEFLRNRGACQSGQLFALNFASMRDCYDALLRCEAGPIISLDWMLWILYRIPQIAPESLRRKAYFLAADLVSPLVSMVSASSCVRAYRECLDGRMDWAKFESFRAESASAHATLVNPLLRHGPESSEERCWQLKADGICIHGSEMRFHEILLNVVDVLGYQFKKSGGTTVPDGARQVLGLLKEFDNPFMDSPKITWGQSMVEASHRSITLTFDASEENQAILEKIFEHALEQIRAVKGPHEPPSQ